MNSRLLFISTFTSEIITATHTYWCPIQKPPTTTTTHSDKCLFRNHSKMREEKTN